ncbi:hypothetical protein BTA51_03175 [Hahella sp. CCB-MM4]|uniref:hypothetical protein n=1 Tax=Hahella sp. (strain CCB-MM4) TaxID=1926491 RepID=UPI000B9B1007|nr:hypothetical protein [Hahella sp. CCB-MM4]OZG75393.1 hypothetical protein BTA51_03175 [Hahella sp. CCB-MM4]
MFTFLFLALFVVLFCVFVYVATTLRVRLKSVLQSAENSLNGQALSKDEKGKIWDRFKQKLVFFPTSGFITCDPVIRVEDRNIGVHVFLFGSGVGVFCEKNGNTKLNIEIKRSYSGVEERQRSKDIVLPGNLKEKYLVRKIAGNSDYNEELIYRLLKILRTCEPDYIEVSDESYFILFQCECRHREAYPDHYEKLFDKVDPVLHILSEDL